MEFDWDPAKNAENERKHGVSFADAVGLWDDLYVEVEEIAYSEDGEQRNAILGRLSGKIYVAIWTKRGEVIRLISVRRARKNEEEVFFDKIQERS